VVTPIVTAPATSGLPLWQVVAVAVVAAILGAVASRVGARLRRHGEA